MFFHSTIGNSKLFHRVYIINVDNLLCKYIVCIHLARFSRTPSNYYRTYVFTLKKKKKNIDKAKLCLIQQKKITDFFEKILIVVIIAYHTIFIFTHIV